MLYTKKGATVNRHSLSFFVILFIMFFPGTGHPTIPVHLLAIWQTRQRLYSATGSSCHSLQYDDLPFQAFFVISYTVVFSVNLDKFHCLAE